MDSPAVSQAVPRRAISALVSCQIAVSERTVTGASEEIIGALICTETVNDTEVKH